MIALPSAFLEAALNQLSSPLVLMRLTKGATTFEAVQAARPSLGLPTSVAGITAIGTSVDPFTREPSVSELTITMSRDGLFDGWLLFNELSGARVELLLGFSTAASASDLVGWFTGILTEIIPQRTHFELRVEDAFSLLRDSNVVGDFPNRHPLEAMRELAEESNIAALVDTATLDPDVDTDRSHYVVHRSGTISPTTPTVRIEQPESALTNFADLATLMGGSAVPRNDGRLAFITFDPAAAAVRHLTQDDYRDLEVVSSYENLVNRFAVEFRFGGYSGALEHSEDDTTSQAAHAYPGETARIAEHVHSTRWVEGFGVITNETILSGPGAGFSALPATPPSYPWRFFVSNGRAGGMCGARVDRTLNASNEMTQPANATVNSTRFVYLGVEAQNAAGGRVFEIIRVTLVEFLSDQYQDTDGRRPAGVPTKEYHPWRLYLTINSSADRGLFGTPVIDWNQFNSPKVNDLTIPIALATEKIRRFSNGAPVLRFSTNLRHFDLEIGDLVTLDADWFLKFGYGGLDTDTKFEVVGKEVVLGDVPRIDWTVCYATSTSAPPIGASNTVRRSPIGVDVRENLETAEDNGSPAWVPRVIEGFEASAGTGLEVDITSGTVGDILNSSTFESGDPQPLPASADTYFYADPKEGTVFRESVSAGASIPTPPRGAIPIARVTTDTTAVTSVVDRRPRRRGVSSRAVTGPAIDSFSAPVGGLSSNAYLQR